MPWQDRFPWNCSAAFAHFDLGGQTLTALYDGFFQQHADGLVGLDTAARSAALIDSGLPVDSWPVAVQCFALAQEHRTILFDAGTAKRLYPTLGLLPQSLSLASIDAEDVTDVVLTHLHPDHSNGITRDDGERLFPNARIHVARAEYEYWLGVGREFTNDESHAFCQSEARFALAPYTDKILLFDDGDELVPSVRALQSTGHTLGHFSFSILGTTSSMIIMGDAAHFAPLQLHYPCLSMAHDHAPDQAVTTRQHLFAEIAAKGRLIAAAHFPFPGVGHIKQCNGEYDFLPESPQQSAALSSASASGLLVSCPSGSFR